jgi:cytochrome d ubiquinol oxidase subunit II
MSETFPILWACVVAFALAMYITLDGFDLGVGALLLTARDVRDRDLMIHSVAPVWDANETWVVLAGVGLLGGFPLAYGVLLPAFYIPLVGMLLCLAFRGVAFEFRFQTVEHRHLWDYAFSFGSIGAALFQGLVVGGLLRGVSVEEGKFAGGTWDFLSPLSLLTSSGLVSGYALIGAAWLNYRTSGSLQARSRRFAILLIPCFVLLAISTALAAGMVEPRVGFKWTSEIPTVGVILGIAFVTTGILVWRLLVRGREHIALYAAEGLLLIAFAGLVATLWPYLIPYNVTILQAASPERSQLVLLVGVGIVVPFILIYSGYAYYVFRGKVKASEPFGLEEGDIRAEVEI